MFKIPVFYRPEQSVKDSQSFSPSAGKPALVVQEYTDMWPHVTDITSFEPVTREMLKRVHRPDYVDGVLDLTHPNGFGNTLKSIADALPYSVGSMVGAARFVMATDHPVACSPTSGFHHAQWHDGGGFCTFNGLMVAATEALALGAARVAIVDCDMHYGNGTDDIIDKLSLRDKVFHYTSGLTCTKPEDRVKLFTELHTFCKRTFPLVDVILYQAGADQCSEDPLGGVLNPNELFIRDEMVFHYARATQTPIVWNLAGGYNVEADGSIPKVLAIHNNTFVAAVKVFA